MTQCEDGISGFHLQQEEDHPKLTILPHSLIQPIALPQRISPQAVDHRYMQRRASVSLSIAYVMSGIYLQLS
jgi:hypothetical protein